MGIDGPALLYSAYTHSNSFSYSMVVHSRLENESFGRFFNDEYAYRNARVSYWH